MFCQTVLVRKYQYQIPSEARSYQSSEIERMKQFCSAPIQSTRGTALKERTSDSEWPEPSRIVAPYGPPTLGAKSSLKDRHSVLGHGQDYGGR